MRPRTVARWLGKTGLVLLALLLSASTVAIIDGWRAFGHRATGERRARMQRSPQWKDGKFHNPQPLINSAWGMMKGLLAASPHVGPSGPVTAAETLDPARLRSAPPTGLRMTWLGHSTQLIEIDGHRILTDPVWSDRASPLDWIGPRRWYRPAIALGDLPPIDAVLISHDHYDHLDHRTLTAMKDWAKTTFIVPLGIGAHLAYWGIPESRIVELDWWERTRVGQLEVVCTPARHASGRTVLFDSTLWAGWALLGSPHRAFYSGDTGLFPAMREIGQRLGPFDVTSIEVGQYHSAWPDWHIGPEQAVLAHQLLRGKVLVPVHWGLFALAYHGWTEPAERVLAAAKKAGVTLVLPHPGQSIEPEAPAPPQRWWPELPWETAAQHPIVSSQMN
jgi:L-ascorbate metabolism protein UlaG (beta-lactamase superfamily)